jgi:hypothetical protein
MALPFAVLAALLINTWATISLRQRNYAWRLLVHLTVWCACGWVAYTIDSMHSSAGQEARVAALYQNFTSALLGGGILFVCIHDGLISLGTAFLHWSILKMRRQAKLN